MRRNRPEIVVGRSKCEPFCEQDGSLNAGSTGWCMKNLDVYLSGERLWGDDFDPSQIEEWYRDEEEAYAQLGAVNKDTYTYQYHALNRIHVFNDIDGYRFNSVLGFGSAYGDEFLPIIASIGRLTIIEPSGAFTQSDIKGVPCTYVRPSADGILPFDDDSFDLITCFGVLHHIPNVSAVVNEFFRCLMPGGKVLMREPIHSMGDWTRQRPGLTKRERGIPIRILTEIAKAAGFEIDRLSYGWFPPVTKLCGWLGITAYNNALVTRVDRLLCYLTRWNVRYQGNRFVHKFRPLCAHLVLSK